MSVVPTPSSTTIVAIVVATESTTIACTVTASLMTLSSGLVMSTGSAYHSTVLRMLLALHLGVRAVRALSLRLRCRLTSLTLHVIRSRAGAPTSLSRSRARSARNFGYVSVAPRCLIVTSLLTALLQGMLCRICGLVATEDIWHSAKGSSAASLLLLTLGRLSRPSTSVAPNRACVTTRKRLGLLTITSRSCRRCGLVVEC